MILFINDTKVRLKKIAKSTILDQADLIIREDRIDIFPSGGHIVFNRLSESSVLALVSLLDKEKQQDVKSITVIVKSPKSIYAKILKNYRFIEAAGGIVTKGDSVLMIHRLGLWDFPKGKMEKGETIEQCAVREVEEECCIKVKLKSPLKNTYHTFVTKGQNKVLKKTYWYEMDLISDKKMKPQIEEAITDIRWVPISEIDTYIENSYDSLKYLFEKYRMKNSIY